MNRLASAVLCIGGLLVSAASGFGCSSTPSGSGSSGSSSSGSSSSGSSGSGSGTRGDATSGNGASSGSADAGGAGSGSATGEAKEAGAGKDAAIVDATTADAHPSSDAGSEPDALAAARAQCVQIINTDRATLTPPSPPLTENTAEEACVDSQAQADFVAQTPHSAFQKCKEEAQDECPDWPGPPSSIMTNCLAEMWAEGPPEAGQDNHWLNMSNPHYTKVACGFYQTPSGSWWATQDFWP